MILEILQKAADSCTAKHLALSGGLDSTILAYLLKHRKPQCIAVISKKHTANDLPYSQMAAQAFGLHLEIKSYDIAQILEAVENTVKILGNFNDIEIRNNIVPYLAISEIKNSGFDKIITGDGADEIFAGYNFLLTKSEDDLKSDLSRLSKIMHFPSQKIGNSLGVKVESPFCHPDVIKYALDIPASKLVNTHQGKKYGKFILREMFEGSIPHQIVWRSKSPMQEGSGTQGLTEFFERMTPDGVFIKKIQQIRHDDNITIRTKESLFYYELFKKYHTIKTSSEDSCPDCRHTMEVNSKFCRMCGRFPI